MPTEQLILDTALARWKLAADAEAEIRKESLDDFDFRKGKQWNDEVKRFREAQKLPCLTTNRLPRTISMVTNEQRQQKPSVQVNPVGDGADKETAEILQGTIRHIEVNSDAEVARDIAFEHMVTGGFGYWRVLTKYSDDNSFEQDIFIEPIENPFAVYRDPYSSLVNYSTAKFYFVVDDLSPDVYKEEFPRSKLATLNFSGIGDTPAGWVERESVRIAEYFYIEQTAVTLYLLKDGTVTEEKPEDKALIARSRRKLVPKVKWCKINAIEILDSRDWPGKYIPIIPVFGDASKVDGKLYLAGLVRDAKDPQRSYNYWISRAAEACQVAPKAPYIAAAGQIEDFKEIWERANIENMAYLPYKAISVDGVAVPPPQRNAVEPPIAAMAEMIRQSDNDFKVATGVYDASLGKQGPESSGRAVLARQKQTDISILNFSDNLSRSLRYEARILLDLIPKVYPPEKLQRIIKPDQTVEHVPIANSQAQVAAPPEQEAQ